MVVDVRGSCGGFVTYSRRSVRFPLHKCFKGIGFLPSMGEGKNDGATASLTGKQNRKNELDKPKNGIVSIIKNYIIFF